MTTVPPPNVALPQVLAAAAAPTTIVITQPPPALAAVAAGTTVEAIVLPPPPASSVAQPTVILRTAVGDLPVSLPIQLPERAQLDLEIVRATPQQVTVRLTSIDGAPALQYLAQNRVPAAPLAAPAPTIPATPTQLPAGPQPLPLGMSWTPSGPAPFVQTGTISAVITQAPPTPEAAPPIQPPTPTTAPAQPATPAQPAAPAPALPTPTLAALPVGTGSELALKIISVQMPGAPVTSAPAQPPAPFTPSPVVTTTPPISALAVSAPAAAPPASLPAAQPGLVFAKAIPPATPQPPATVQPAAPLASATGTVIANADALPIVDIEGRHVQLNARANLPLGTKIVFEVTGAAPPRIGTPLPLPSPAAATPLTGPPSAHTGWPSLIESVSLLQRADPVSAQQLAQAIPDGGPRTIAAVISFVQAMRTGDARQWPGDANLRALERSGPRGAHLAATLSSEVAELASRARDTGAEWRAIPIPWNAGGEIDRVALITRREGEGETDGARGKGGGGTRFLIDLNLSRLGPLQLDGMFKKEARAFDMVLRTKAALQEEMRRDLTGIFVEANGAMGLKGNLTFQVTKKFADPLGLANSSDKSGLWA